MEAGVEVEIEDKLLTRVINGYLENPSRTDEVNETIEQLSDHLKLLADIFKVAVPSLTTETIEEADKMGAVAFINKPFTPDELLETIRQVIQKEDNHGKK